ncbi:murein biosynthesis integral membrane protein MurJ [Candidatus Roizmanbacteria bacterium]|nr:murein biosynthesis integral membrane protein MurJ [Candidatus Roizmanbacteria bacterium]
MNYLLNRTKNFIFAKQTSIFSSTLILAAMVIISRIFGFVRYRVLAGYFTKEELDIYFAAFRIPDLVFEILITGALTTAFIPFYIKYQKDKEAQSQNISSIINIITLALGGAIIVLTLCMPVIMELITPGFSQEKIHQITFYSQLILLGQLPFFIWGNFLTGISQARKLFIIPSIAPVLYNLCIIGATFAFAPTLRLLAPVLGVILGAILFLVIQLPILFSADFRYQFIIRPTKALNEFFSLILPRIMTVIVAQIDATIDLSLTTLLGAGSYTIFYLAQHLQLLPVSVIGITFGQASLPYLTELYQKKNINEFKKIIIDSVLNLFFFTIPFMAYFVFARTPIVRFFFGADKFDWEATVLTAFTLSFFALSLPLHSVYYFLTRCFYALFDSKTPFYIGLFSILFNTVLSLISVLVLHLPVWALSISFSLSMSLNTILLFVLLYRRLQGLDVGNLIRETVKMGFAAAIASVFAYSEQKLLDGLILDTTRTINVFLLLLFTGLTFVLIYLVLCWLFNVQQMYLITKMALKIKEYQRKIFEIYSDFQ